MTGICTILSTLPHILTLSKVWEKYFTTTNTSPQATIHFSALFSAKHFKRPVYTQCHLLLSSSLMNPLESGFYPMETCRELAPDIVNNDLHVVKSKVTSPILIVWNSSAVSDPVHPSFLKSLPLSSRAHLFPGVSCCLTGYLHGTHTSFKTPLKHNSYPRVNTSAPHTNEHSLLFTLLPVLQQHLPDTPLICFFVYCLPSESHKGWDFISSKT